MTLAKDMKEETPGPCSYDVGNTLLDDGTYKNYGFIEKSKRFRSPAKDERALVVIGSNSEENTKPHEQIKLPKIEKDEYHKMKKEISKWKDQYTRISKIHEREMKSLEDKISKIDVMFQTCLKEKNHLQSQIVFKEKECAELVHKQTILYSNLEKAEKMASSYQDKAIKSTSMQRKLEDMEKTHLKVKLVADKKLVQENEIVLSEINSIQRELETLKQNKEHSDSLIALLNNDKKEMKNRISELSQEIQKLAHEKMDQEINFKSEISNLEKKLQNFDAKESEELAELKKLLHESKKSQFDAQESFESQRVAYLGRINQLESDLEHDGNAMHKKDQELENTLYELKSVSEKLEHIQRELDNRNASFSYAEKERETKIKSLNKSIDSLQKQLFEEEQKKKQSIENLEELKLKNGSVIESLKSEISGLKDELSEVKDISTKKISMYESKLQREEQTILELQTAISALKQKLENVKKETSSQMLEVRSELETIQKKLLSNMHEMENNYNNKNCESKNQMESLRHNLNDKEKQFLEYSQTAEKDKKVLKDNIIILNNSINDLNEKLDQAEKTIQCERKDFLSSKILFEQSISDLQSKLSLQSDTHKNQDSLLNEMLKEEKQKCERMKKECADLTLNFSSRESLHQNQVVLLNTEKESLRTEISRLNDQLGSSIEKNHEFQSQISILNTKCSEFEVSLNTSSNDFKKTNEDLQTQNNILREEIESYIDQCNDQNVIIQEQEDKLIQIKNSEESLKSELISKDKEINLQNTKINELEKNLISIQTSADKKNVELMSSKDNAKTLEAKLAVLNNNLSENQNCINLLENEIKMLKSALVDKESFILVSEEEYKMNMNSYASKLNEMENQLQIKQQDLEMESTIIDEHKLKLEQYEKYIDENQSQIHSLESEIFEYQKNVLTFEDTINEQNQTISDLDSQISSIQDEHKLKICEMEKEMDILSDKLKFSETSLGSSNVNMQIMNETITKYETQIKKMEFSIEELNAAISEANLNTKDITTRLNEKCEKSEYELKNMTACASNVELMLAESKQNIEGLNLKVSHLETEINHKNENINNLNLKLTEMSVEIGNLQNKLNENLTNLNQKDIFISDLESNNSELQSIVVDYETRILKNNTEITEFKKIISEEEAKNKNYELLVTELKNQIGQLEQQLNDHQDLYATKMLELKQTEDILADLKLSLDTSKSENKGKNEAINAMEIAIQEKDLIIENLESSEIMLKTNIEDLQSQIDLQCSQNASQLAGMDAELECIKNSNYELESKLDNLIKEKELLQEQHLNSIEISSSEIAKQKADLNNLESECQLLRDNITFIQSQLSAAEALYQDLKEKSDSEIKSRELKHQSVLKTCQVEITNLQDQLEAVNAEMSIKLASLNSELKNQNNLNIELSNRHQELLDKFKKIESDHNQQFEIFRSEKSELETEVKVKKEMLDELNQKLSEHRDKLRLVELRLLNATSSKEQQLQLFEEKLSRKTEECDILQKSSLEHKKGYFRFKEENQNLSSELSQVKEELKKCKKLELSLKQERNNLESRLDELKVNQNKSEREAERLKIMNEEMSKYTTEMQQEFQTQLKILQQNGKLNQNEIKQLGELNAEMFGHSNIRQKIRYVSQLKEENILLKKENLAVCNQMKEYKNKLLEASSNIDNLMAIGGGGKVKKASRTARTAIEVLEEQEN